MNTTPMYDADQYGEHTGSVVGTVVAASFADRELAHDAAHALHEEGFRETWIGITRVEDRFGYAGSGDTSVASDAETHVESDNWFMRFFGEGDATLHDALVHRGVSDLDARAAGILGDGSAILTVDGANHPESAVEIISRCGGQMITRGFGSTGYGTTGTYASASPATEIGASTGAFADTSARQPFDALAAQEIPTSTPAQRYDAEAVTVGTSSDAGQAYDDYGRFRAGQPVDESTRLQLREERLRIDKTRLSRGEATVGTEVVTESHEIDVPLVREELFVQRRAVTNGTATDTTPIGAQRDVIRVPLTEEQVSITKTPVVTEEVVVGKRQVEETQHVSETTRREELTVNDVDPVTSSTTRI